MKDFFDLLKNDHHQFDQGKLEDHLGTEPFSLVAKWLREAIEHNESEPNAMSISTIDLNGFPDSRIVYLKELLEEGAVFYSNYNSAKGKSIDANPKIHALLFWPGMERQIRIKGVVEKIPASMSDDYFNTRPWSSKIGAWASAQSEIVASREELEDQFKYFAQLYPAEVPRPPHWGGYLIKPMEIEFWQGRPSRLHDRIVFLKEDENWKICRKNP
ncbi:MAG: pyridoxamine 5'-phosphate oxidase [Bacteroidota bacterium]